MAMLLYAHPFSSFAQKVLIAFWEKGIEFEYRNLETPGATDELRKIWPLGRFPVLVDKGRVLPESSIIIEYLDRTHPEPVRLIPEDPAAALHVRLLDRLFDLEVNRVMQMAVAEALRGERADRQKEAIETAGKALDVTYGWLEGQLRGQLHGQSDEHTWAAGQDFSMADCAAAPALFYADWVHRIGEAFPTLRAYRARLLQRPSVARAVEEGRPYRCYFPLGAPDRD